MDKVIITTLFIVKHLKNLQFFSNFLINSKKDTKISCTLNTRQSFYWVWGRLEASGSWQLLAILAFSREEIGFLLSSTKGSEKILLSFTFFFVRLNFKNSLRIFGIFFLAFVFAVKTTKLGKISFIIRFFIINFQFYKILTSFCFVF